MVQQLPTSPNAPARESHQRVGFWRAAAAPWTALGFLLSTPSTWPLAVVPLACAALVAVPCAYLAVTALPPVVAGVLPAGASWYAQALRAVLPVLAAVAAATAALLLGLVLAQPLSAPALERLVRLRERALGRPARPPTSLLDDVSRSARSALIGTLSLPLVLGLSLVEIVVPGSSLFVLPLKLVVTAMFVSWDLLDYPLSIRDLGLRTRIAWVFGHGREVMGFGLSLAIVFLLPCAQLLLLPAGVVGAAALVCAVEDAERPRDRR